MFEAKSRVANKETDVVGKRLIAIAHFTAEKRLGRNTKTQPHHFIGNINTFPSLDERFPSFQHRTCFAADHSTQSVNLILMEGGVHQASLAKPEIAIAGQQAIADDGADICIGACDGHT